jgi:hypothetical protein
MFLPSHIRALRTLRPFVIADTRTFMSKSFAARAIAGIFVP